MPFIAMTTNVKIEKDKLVVLKQKFGEAVTIIPGKTEDKTMMSFADCCPMFFKGKDEPMAFVEVKCYGKSSGDAYNEMTGAVCGIIYDVLAIDPAQIYVRYDETPYWGCNGKNMPNAW